SSSTAGGGSEAADGSSAASTSQRAPCKNKTAAQLIEDKLAEAETRWTEMLEQQKEELSTLWSQIIDDKLKAHSEAVENFAVEERVVTLEDGQPSRVDEDKIVIVVNAAQLDELREALRAHRSHAQATKKTSDAIDQLWDKIEGLRARESTDPDTDDPDRTLHDESTSRARKRARSSASPIKGRPHAAAQNAFDALLREAFGISKGDDWPAYPDIPQDHPDWPRHPLGDLPPEDENDDEANIDPALRENPILGEPKLRLDWIHGAMNDPAFKGVIKKYASMIANAPDDYDLPDDDERRDSKQIVEACKHTLDNIKRTARNKLQNKTVADMLTVECVEADETEDEGGLGEDGEKREKVVREIIPEWWSAENRELQKKLESLVPVSSGGYTVQPAIWLRPWTKSLSRKIPRIAVNAKWAEDHPDLVTELKKNKQPFKPSAGAVAANADAFGRPIRGLTIRAELESYDDDDDDDLLGAGTGGSGAGAGVGAGSALGGGDAEDPDEEESFEE
ncbi:hypothetical protein V8E36_007775, partial [Tilletia maclaganii]